MPEPLDPLDAVVSAFTDMLKRCGLFLAVTGGAALLGWNIHRAPNILASFATLRFGAIRQAYESVDASLVANWFFMMMHSVTILWALPFVFFYVTLLVRLWRDGDLFQILFSLALSHSAHVFIYLQYTDPFSGGALAASIAMFLISEAILAALLLWWQHVSENAPLLPEERPGDAEPEL